LSAISSLLKLVVDIPIKRIDQLLDRSLSDLSLTEITDLKKVLASTESFIIYVSNIDDTMDVIAKREDYYTLPSVNSGLTVHDLINITDIKEGRKYFVIDSEVFGNKLGQTLAHDVLLSKGEKSFVSNYYIETLHRHEFQYKLEGLAPFKALEMIGKIVMEYANKWTEKDLSYRGFLRSTQILNLCKDKIPKDGLKFLDVGTGDGMLALELVNYMNKNGYTFCSKLTTDSDELVYKGGLPFVKNNKKYLEFYNANFITVSQVLHHVEDLETTFENLSKLDSGSVVVIREHDLPIGYNGSGLNILHYLYKIVNSTYESPSSFFKTFHIKLLTYEFLKEKMTAAGFSEIARSKKKTIQRYYFTSWVKS
jgi:ubiquinone/menaquinone biosynthesis C-methylase UbiE